MQGFAYNERLEPAKRDVLARIKNFGEIYDLFIQDDAQVQSERCIQCGDPYCHNKCPLHNFIPQWLKSVAIKDLDLAFKISNETSPFPEIMGRICPHDRLCEGDCTLNDGHGAITIGSVETFISETAFDNGITPTYAPLKGDKKVAIIGPGPMGLSAATFLMRHGVHVTMYEQADRAGGLLTYGIPNFKLDKSVVERRVRWLLEAGMKLHVNTQVGKDISFEAVKANHDALIIAVGATQSNVAHIENEDHTHVFKAIEFLTAVQKHLFGDNLAPRFDVKGKNVVVVGGGDTAMDCLRTSIRHGATQVTCLYRRDQANMPGSRKEFKNAVEEGAEFSFLTSPKRVIVENGVVTGIEVVQMSLGEPDSKVRQNVSEIPNSHTIIPCDIVIMALSFSVNVPFPLETHSWGGLVIDEKGQTSDAKVFAGGDYSRGADLVVTAAFDGREVAKTLLKRLI